MSGTDLMVEGNGVKKVHVVSVKVSEILKAAERCLIRRQRELCSYNMQLIGFVKQCKCFSLRFQLNAV